PSASSFPCCFSSDPSPWRPPGWSVIQSRHSSSTALDHAMVAELFHNPRLEGGGDGGVHGTHVPALVAGHGGAPRQRGRAREAVIGAMGALADGAEQEVACHVFSLRRWATSPLQFSSCPRRRSLPPPWLPPTAHARLARRRARAGARTVRLRLRPRP